MPQTLAVSHLHRLSQRLGQPARRSRRKQAQEIEIHIEMADGLAVSHAAAIRRHDELGVWSAMQKPLWRGVKPDVQFTLRSSLVLQSHFLQQSSKPRIRAQAIAPRLYFDMVESRIALLVGLFQPRERLILLSKAFIDDCYPER